MAKIVLVSDGAKANLDLSTKDGAIVATQSTDASKPSNTITLKGGKHYYLEVLAKEGGECPTVDPQGSVVRACRSEILLP
jgi:hypothetical protein